MRAPQKKTTKQPLAKKKGYQASKAKAIRLNWPTAKASGTVSLKKELHKKSNIRYFPKEDHLA